MKDKPTEPGLYWARVVVVHWGNQITFSTIMQVSENIVVPYDRDMFLFSIIEWGPRIEQPEGWEEPW